MRGWLAEWGWDLAEYGWDLAKCGWDLLECGWDLAECGWYVLECGWDLAECGWDVLECRWDLADCGWESSQVWMRSSGVVGEFDCQCRSRNSPGFDPSIRSTDTVKSEVRQMKQCSIKNYINSPYKRKCWTNWRGLLVNSLGYSERRTEKICQANDSDGCVPASPGRDPWGPPPCLPGTTSSPPPG